MNINKKNFANIKFNCTKEASFSLLQAEKLAISLNDVYIEPIHLVSSILLLNNISIKIFNFKSKNLIIKILNKTKKKFYNINIKKQKSFNKQIYFSTKLLKLLFTLTNINRSINTLDLFFKLSKDQDPKLKYFFKELNIKKKNIYFKLKERLIKISSNNTLFIEKFAKKISLPNVKIIGREKEIFSILEILNRQTKKNVILIGENGIGRHFIVYKLLKTINNKGIDNMELWDLNIVKFLNIFSLNKDFEIQFNNDIDKKKNIIFVCSDIHLLFSNINFNSELDINILSFLNSLLSNDRIQFIGVITPIDFNKKLSSSDLISKFFDTILIKEPFESEIKQILNNFAHKLELIYNIYILPEALFETLNLSKKYLKNKKFPEKALYIIDTACMKVIIKKNKKKEISKKVTLINVQQAVSDISGIPFNLISNKINNKFNLKNLETLLKSNIFGQNKAIIQITTAVKRAQTGLKSTNKPIGSWIFCGPSGTGKTELSKTIANYLFGSESEIIRFDMSEFMEKHSISRLIGSPPGYIGYGEGGQLTKAIQKKPFSVILFDEIEKAHEDVNNLMLQLLDEGRLTDSSGLNVDFSNTIIIFTSNLGCPKNPLEFNSFVKGINFTNKDYKILSNNINIAIKKHFKPEFINRLDSIIVFKPLNISDLILISNKFFDLLRIHIKDKHILLSLNIKYEVKHVLSKLSYHPLYGARPLKRVIEKFIEKPISELILNFNLKNKYNLSFFIDKKFKTLNYSLIKL